MRVSVRGVENEAVIVLGVGRCRADRKVSLWRQQSNLPIPTLLDS